MFDMKVRSQFVCQECGAVYSKWVGQCTNCDAWNSLLEQEPDPSAGKKAAIEKARVSGRTLD